MSKKVLLLLVLIFLVALMAPGCNSDDDNPVTGSETGTVSVTLDTGSSGAAAAPAPSPLAASSVQFNVTFSSLSLYNSDGSVSADLITEPTTLDLMQYETGDLLGDYPVPAGSYNCIDAQIQTVQVIQDGRTCTLSNPGIQIPAACLNSEVLVVQEDGTYEVLFELPVVNVSCSQDGGIPEFHMDDPHLSLVR